MAAMTSISTRNSGRASPGISHRGPCWAPGLDAEDPRRFLHDARGCRAGGAQHVADVLVDLLGLTPPVPDAGDRAVGVVRDLTGQIQQAPTVDDHALVELTAVVLRVVFFEQRLAARGPAEVHDELDLDQHRRVGQPPHDQPRRRRPAAEEFGPLRPAARVVGVEVRHVDELFDDVVEPRLGAREDALQTLERAPRLWPHPARDELSVGVSPGQPGGEQEPRRIDAHGGHEATTALEWAFGENVSTIHHVLLQGRTVGHELAGTPEGPYCAGGLGASRSLTLSRESLSSKYSPRRSRTGGTR